MRCQTTRSHCEEVLRLRKALRVGQELVAELVAELAELIGSACPDASVWCDAGGLGDRVDAFMAITVQEPEKIPSTAPGTTASPGGGE